MPNKKMSVIMCAFLMLACVTLLPSSATAATEKLLHVFTDGSDGGEPSTGLIRSADGSLYGSAFVGGTNGYGVIFKMTPGSSGWTETVLYNFQGGTTDGAYPEGGLAFDTAGNLYGSTIGGGIDWNDLAVRGWGTVFKLSPSNSGYTESVIHFFAPSERPSSGISTDRSGNLYGETGGAGTSVNQGSVFAMKTVSSKWKYETLHTFTGGSDGAYPEGGLTFDVSGNLYGVTASGGDGCRAGCGTVFEVSRGANNSWTEDVLYSFKGLADGDSPQYETLAINSAGNLYGTTAYGGDLSCDSGNGGVGCGNVFEVSHSSGSWTETTLYAFNNPTTDGSTPYTGVTFDQAGDLLGTTVSGGSANLGTLFKLTRQSDETWAETLLFSFSGNYGEYPSNPLLVVEGNVLGTVPAGGADGWGVAFEFPGVAQ